MIEYVIIAREEFLFMRDFVIISDGSCDLSTEKAKDLGVEIVPFMIKFLDDEYKREGVDIKVRDFYQLLVDNPNVFPKSSLPPVSDYLNVFKKYLDQNLDVICLCISTKLSGSYNSAMQAKQTLEEDYKDARITVIDTKSVTALQGLIVKEAVRVKNLGYTYDEVVEAICSHLSSGRIFFTIKGLAYLKNGGRIGKVSSLIGDFLKIAPIITFKDGEIFSSGVAISRQRSLAKIKQLATSYLIDSKASPETYCLGVGYGYDIEEGKKFLADIKKMFPEYEIDFEQIGSAISAHTGPYPLGFGFIKKFDK